MPAVFDYDSGLMSESVVIIESDVNQIIDLRHAILRAGLPREEAMFVGDDLATSLHVAAVIRPRVVGCATFHLNSWYSEPAYQLRGMATDDSVRRQGIGRRMLHFGEQELLKRNVTPQLWCNARTPAVAFYQSMGWTVVSEVFDISTAGPHVRMVKRLVAGQGVF